MVYEIFSGIGDTWYKIYFQALVTHGIRRDIFSGIGDTWYKIYFQALVTHGIRCSVIQVPDTDHFNVIENLQNDDYVLTKVGFVITYKPCHKKTCFLHMRKQRCRSVTVQLDQHLWFRYIKHICHIRIRYESLLPLYEIMLHLIHFPYSVHIFCKHLTICRT